MEIKWDLLTLILPSNEDQVESTDGYFGLIGQWFDIESDCPMDIESKVQICIELKWQI